MEPLTGRSPWLLVLLQSFFFVAFLIFIVGGLYSWTVDLKPVSWLFLILALATWFSQSILFSLRYHDCINWLLWRFGILDSTPTGAERYGVPTELKEWAKMLDDRAEVIWLQSCILTGNLLIHEFGKKLARIYLTASKFTGNTSEEDLQRSKLIEEVEGAQRYLQSLGDLIYQTPSSLRALDLAEMVKETVSKLPRRDEERITLDFDTHPEVHGVRSLIIAAIRNLIQNALRFSSGRITISLLPPEEDQVVLRIADFGRSLNAEEINATFHFGPPRQPSQKGAGIGLPLSRAFIKLHNGDLNYIERSTPEEPKAFEIRLPLAVV